MPMLDAYIPEGALSPQAEENLMARLTNLLLEHEGADTSNETARSIAWVFRHRVDVFVAGAPADAPRYRFVASVPEGQFNAERRQAIVEGITEAVLDAEEGARPRDPTRVWVFPTEAPDGTWGGGGRIVTLADVAGLVMGDADKGRAYAERVLGERRRETAPAPA